MVDETEMEMGMCNVVEAVGKDNCQPKEWPFLGYN